MPVSDLLLLLRQSRVILSGFEVTALKLFLLTLFAAIIDSIGVTLIIPLISSLTSPSTHLLLPAIFNFALAYNRLQIFSLSAILIGSISILKELFILWKSAYFASFGSKLQNHWRLRLISQTITPSNISAATGTGSQFDLAMLQLPSVWKVVKAFLNIFSDILFASAVVISTLLVAGQHVVLILISLFILFLFSFSKLRGSSTKAGRQSYSNSQQITKYVSDGFAGARELYAYQAVEIYLRQLKALQNNTTKILVKDTILRQIPQTSSEALLGIILVVLGVIALYSQLLVISQALPFLAMFLFVAKRLFSHYSTITGQLVSLWIAQKSVASVLAVATQPQVTYSYPFFSLKEDDQNLSINSLSFSYTSDRNILNELSFSFQPGTITSIVGSSGSGKTTLLDLILRFKLPSHGCITYSNTNISQIDPQVWYDLIAYVPQHPYLLEATLVDNITLFSNNFSHQEIATVLNLPFIRSITSLLPLGHSTKINQGGNGLSGGQIQRIAIARSLLRKPRILLLDEPTSGLDCISKSQVLTAIRNQALNGTIVIVVTHDKDVVTASDSTLLMT